MLAKRPVFRAEIQLVLLDVVDHHEIVLPGLVEEIEAGRHDSDEAVRIIRKGLTGLTSDVLVLACTHYAFAIPSLNAVAGPEVMVIDPAPAVARQAGRLLEAVDSGSGVTRYVTSGNLVSFRVVVERLLGLQEVDAERALWKKGRLELSNV